MDHSALETTLCERCSLLAFDDRATGCRAVTDENGVAKLLFDEAKVEWRCKARTRETLYYKLIRLRWHLDDSLPHLPALSNSSQSGCDFCKTLLDYLQMNQSAGLLSRYDSIHDGPLSLAAYISLCEERIEGLVIELVSNKTESEEKSVRVHFPIEASPSCHKWLGAEPARHDSYLTPENISTIRRVLAECTAGCHPWKATTFLPTRLIDVGTSLSDTPRLVSSSNIFITTETKYATLSYCWGNREDAEAQLKTERATIEKRCEGIPCEIMTPAIKDAVELTRAIGLRYIWIDALCIIQDDISDWSYESGQMNRVFHHAFVTFCGLSSTSCHEPFLRRVRTITVPFQSALRPELNGYLSVRLRPTTTDHHERRGYPLDRFISMWAYRAWIYQEEKLSTRLLLFGATKMHFRCGTHQWSEGDGNLSRLDSSVISLHHRTIDIKQGEYPASSLYRNWNILVKDYARREATHETDRLPAISGLARLIWETLGDHYVAGLWKGDIFNGLAWSSMPISYGLQNHLQSIRERVYLAPSWSWASYKGAGIYTDNLGWTTVSDCILLDIDVKPDLQNPFGRVYGGYLRLRGQMTPIPGSLSKIKPNGERSSKWQLNSGGQYGVVTARLDWFQQGEEEEGLENLVMLLLHYGKLTKQPASSHSSHTDSSDSLDETKHLEIEALMLYPTKIPDEYYRVGLVSSYGQAGYNLMRAWFENEGAEKVCTII